MAVYTPLTKTQISNFFLECDLSDIESFEGILQGIDNTNYKVETSNGKYVLTIFESRINPHDIPYFIRYMRHLSFNGIICPVPVHIGDVVDKPAAIFTFLDGNGATLDDITPALCNELGVMLAKMHITGQSFPMQHDNTMLFDAWETRLHRIGHTAHTYSEFLKELKPLWPQNLPKGSIHADLFPDNVFIKDGHVYGIIDFYFACTDFLAYDLAIVMNAWCFDKDNRFNKDKWDALLSGYESVRPLEQQEKDSFQILCQGAALRFLSSRLHDFVFHDSRNLVVPKSPDEYIEKLEFHQNAKLF